MLVSFGCSKYDDSAIRDSITSLEGRATEVEKVCARINSEIESIQALATSLQANDYLVSVAPITTNGAVSGYELVYNSGTRYTLNMGTAGKKGEVGDSGADGKDGNDGDDGADGKDGKNGTAPQISIVQIEGKYYWSVGGITLKDESNNPIPAVGTNGTDAIVPKLRIKDGNWEISTDNAASWTLLGKADGDSAQSLFKSVDNSNDAYCLITLGDDTQMRIEKRTTIHIALSPASITLVGCNSTNVTYTLSGTYKQSEIEAMFTVEGWKTVVTPIDDKTGTITVTAPSANTEGEMMVVAYDKAYSTDVAKIAVKSTAVFGVGCSQTAPYTFPSVNKASSETPAPLTVTLTNTGDQPTGELNIEFSGNHSMYFSASKKIVGSIAVGGNNTFTVVPDSDLGVGVYVATVSACNSNGIRESFDVSFDVIGTLWTDGLTADAATTFSGGNGSSATPYQISSAIDLAQLAVNVNTLANNYAGKYFTLTANIDLTGKYWIPIGLVNAYGNGFRGRFDGNGHRVSNMKIDDREYELADNYTGFSMTGLFGWTFQAYIKNLGLENAEAYVSRNNYGHAGLLLASGDQIQQLENCWVTGMITVASTSCSNSYTSLGGLEGQSYNGPGAKNCYFIGKVICSINILRIAGLLGYNRAGTTTNCYSVVEIEAPDVTSVSALSDVNSSNCYYNSDLCDRGDASGATGKTTAEMKTAAMAVLLNAGGTTWTQSSDKNNGYPYLTAVPPSN